MSELPDFPRHWHFARAIVEACRVTAEDPIRVAEGQRPSRGPAYAYWSLREIFPRPAGTFIMAGLGVAKVSTAHARVYAAKTKNWWRPDVIAPIAEAIRLQAPIIHDAPALVAVAPMSAKPARAPRALSPMARVIDRRPVGAVDMGDPPPGRSALDQRRSAT